MTFEEWWKTVSTDGENIMVAAVNKFGNPYLKTLCENAWLASRHNINVFQPPGCSHCQDYHRQGMYCRRCGSTGGDA